MDRTTVYLPPELKRAVRQMARRRKCSEAELIREALSRLTSTDDSPSPKLPLFRSHGASIAERVDDVLAEGFGRR